MYNIDRFIKEKIGVIFNTKEEMDIFHDDCISHMPQIDCNTITFRSRNLDNIYVVGWDGPNDMTLRLTGGKEEEEHEFLYERGWDVINIEELTTVNFPSKDSLMEFLGE